MPYTHTRGDMSVCIITSAKEVIKLHIIYSTHSTSDKICKESTTLKWIGFGAKNLLSIVKSEGSSKSHRIYQIDLYVIENIRSKNLDYR